MNRIMLDMCRKLHTNNLACSKGCYEQLSNAEDRSSCVNTDTCLLSRPKRISFAVHRSNVSVLCQRAVWPACRLRGAEKIAMN